jgi:D-tyrosyl-tRNA(Tyr) deacylase
VRYEDLVRELRAVPLRAATGEFQATMRVELANDGPVTILIDSKRQF